MEEWQARIVVGRLVTTGMQVMIEAEEAKGQLEMGCLLGLHNQVLHREENSSICEVGSRRNSHGRRSNRGGRKARDRKRNRRQQ